ncbi:HAMP domain-containing sensor histidine kinase [Sulfurimonas sp. HSL-1716]|uniref:sensor histidine kinase n=1 Tax=Hydrocurvibacter sulfurireducens TaxID=3131937 RepID=UPI0031F89FAD
MHHHEKKAFLKFFVTYFLSVAVLILAAGYFYQQQIREQYLKTEEFSLIEYARQIKMGESLEKFPSSYRHSFTNKIDKYIDIRNFKIQNDEFIKYLPMNHNRYYLIVHKPAEGFYQKLFRIRVKIILVQLFLLVLFGFISYKLAKSALNPLEESISKLDKFAKDLIHDLNTPVTSIKLNMKILQKNQDLKENNALLRLNKSVQTISELHENLTVLLQEETFQMSFINVCEVVNEIVQIQKPIYPDINFDVECQNFQAKLNQHAMKQILQNIISNACKYNSKNGFIKIYKDTNSLYIEDGGKGIKEPDKIFERSYSGEHGSGIGLDIVKRLADAMDIKIKVKSKNNGSIFILTMR